MNSLENWTQQILDTKAFKIGASKVLDLLCDYFRTEIDGIENIPLHGPAIIIANHSGFMGFDALVLSQIIRKKTQRHPRMIAHHAYFEWIDWIQTVSLKLRLRKPQVCEAVTTLKENHLLIIFPEGEKGNFKSSFQKYRLQKFHTGFVRMALETGSPVIPCIITGAEESNFNLGNINLERWHRKLRIPLPLNFFPAPAKWRIKILKPLKLESSASIFETASNTQKMMQDVLREELRKRKYIYFPGLF